ncbi:hypothetical protein BD779DRAFT_1673741 [Infundibulicybe gibba]|nr:hypothetical protein BD779DRAFT_1673741 [Infundibulicybe gibba]
MVQISYTLLAFASFFVAGLAAPTTETTFSDLQAGLSLVLTQATSLKVSVENFPASGATLKQAAAIHIAALGLGTTLKATLTTAQSTPPLSVSESKIIASAVVDTKNVVVTTANIMAIRVSSVKSLPVVGVAGVVKADLTNLKAAANAVVDALVRISKPREITILLSYKADIDAPLDRAIAVYSK